MKGRQSVLPKMSLIAITSSVLTMMCLLGTGCMFIGQDRTPASYKSFSSRRELKHATEIRANLDFPIGELELDALSSGDTSAYQVDIEYNENRYSPNLEVSGESAIDFRFDLRHLRKSMGANDKNRGEFRFSRNVPLELHVKTGVGENRIDLTSLKIRDLRLLSGVGEARVTVTAPNSEICRNVEIKSGVGEFNSVGLGNLNFQDLRFEGGVGEANLDFTGDWNRDANLDVRVGIGAVNIALPTTVGAEVHATKSFLSGLSLKDFQKDSSDIYRSNNFDKVKHRLSIEIKSGIGGVDLHWK
ncbi:MAG TPA: LiaF domain-containing protein [Acidobacteriota bacterium]